MTLLFIIWRNHHTTNPTQRKVIRRASLVKRQRLPNTALFRLSGSPTQLASLGVRNLSILEEGIGSWWRSCLTRRMGEENLMVFVGASTEGNEHAVEAKRILEETAADGVELNVRLWKDTFAPGKTPIESLERSIEAFDFAVFVLTKDDLILTRELQAKTPRNNVILELGLFTGKLGRDHVFAIGPSDDDIIMPSDYIGVERERCAPDSGDVRSDIRGAASNLRKLIVKTSLAPRPETRTEAAARSLRMKLGRGSPLSSVGYGEEILRTPKSCDVNGASEMNSPPPPSWKNLASEGLLITVDSASLLYGTDVVHRSWGVGKVVEIGPETDKGRLIVVHFQEGGESEIQAANLYYAALPDR